MAVYKVKLNNTYDIILLCSFSLKFYQALQLSIAFVGCPKRGFYGESCSIPCSKNCFCHITKGTCLGCLPGYRGLTCEESKWHFKSFQCSATLLVFTYCSVAALDTKMIWPSVGRQYTLGVLLIFHTKILLYKYTCT